MQKKLEMLKKIAQCFNGHGITWALGASMLLYFKGAISEFHDIDLLVTMEDAEAAKDLLSAMGQLLPGKSNEGYATKCFLEYEIEGIGVDLMAGFAIIADGTIHDCSLEKEQIAEFAELDGEKIPLQDIRLWRRYYSLMGRTGKVAIIDNFIGDVSGK